MDAPTREDVAGPTEWHSDDRPEADQPGLIRAADTFELAVFEWDLSRNGWWWSDAMYELYGCDPGTTQAGLDALLDRQHPSDRARLERAMERTAADGQPFVFEHRIVTQQLEPHTVVLSVRAVAGDEGRPAALVGISHDVSAGRRIHHATSEESVGGLLAAITRLKQEATVREVINQAIGILMERHHVLASQANEILRRASQSSAQKMETVASELIYTGKLPAGPPAGSPATDKPRSRHPREN